MKLKAVPFGAAFLFLYLVVMMNRILCVVIIVVAFSCKSVIPGKNNNKVTEEELKSYIGEEASVLFADFKIESCNLKIAYFKDAYAMKIALKGNKEIVVVFENKIILTKTEIESQCDEPKIKKGKISKIKFYKDGEETISVE